MKIDFQVYLRNDGAVLNIDLDRCDELIPRTRGPLNDSQKLELAHIPGFCPKASGQKAFWMRLSRSFTGASSDISSQEVSK